MRRIDLEETDPLPAWQRPEGMLMLMALALPLAFSVWAALLNNFTVEHAGFEGVDIGWLQTVREIPGFLAFLAIYLILFIREQRLALFALMLLGSAVAVTGLLPTFWGLILTTTLSSIGFHYFETVNQSLQLQWLKKEEAPRVLGRLAGIGSSTAFIALGAIWLFSGAENFSYVPLYAVFGMATLLIALVGLFAFPQFTGGSPQARRIVLKKRYWLYYLLMFMAGARRQIFVVFAGFMLVERFGYSLRDFTLLLIINHAVNMYFAPMMGRMISRHGERAVLTFEYIGLMLVFIAYALVTDPLVAAALYVIDHLFFGLRFAQKTYFQKIADKADFAPTAAVAFTINHIAAVFLPALLGYLYMISPYIVFVLGACMAGLSLLLARLVPRYPDAGNETTLSRPQAAATEQPSKRDCQASGS